MLLTKKSPYQNFSQHEFRQSLSLLQKKTKSIYHADAREANDEKYLEENLLNKLLRPPAKRQSKGILRKYDPHFPKPDVEKLIHENTKLKNEISQNNKVIVELRFKVKEQQKKISKMESNDQVEVDEILEKKKKDPSAYIEILKKKIHQLHTKFISAEAQIKKLKKLPGASIYQENNIEKQHLLAETIRLKSILTSYQSQNIDLDSDMVDQKQKSQQPTANSLNNAKFQQQFLRMLKQENQKLKATVRLLENDKILMKARQTTQNKQSNDLKKQLDHLKNRLILRQAEIEKLTHQNQNLLFKKAVKFKLEKEEKENKLIQELTKSIEELRLQKKKLESQKNQLLIDNQQLKKKQQAKNLELIEKDKELEKAKFQNAEIKNEYEGRINLLQTNKLYSKQSGLRSKSSKGGGYAYFNTNAYNLNELKKLEDDYVLIRKNGLNQEQMQRNKEQGKFNWGKPIKFEQLDFCLLKIWSLRQEGVIENYEELISQPNQNQGSKNRKKALITFEQLYGVLKAEPICLPSKQSIKLSKYIFSDHSSLSTPENQKADTKQHPMIQISLAITIIKASINQFTECLNNGNIINSWKILLSKSKKFTRELEQYSKQTMSKEQFIEIVIKNKTNTLLFEEINYMLLHGFNSKISANQIYLNRRRILECIYGLMGDPQYLTSIFMRTNLAHFIPSSGSNSSSNQISIMKYSTKENQISRPSKTNNKEIKNPYFNLVNMKPLLTNSYYEPEQKSNKDVDKVLKTHQPHTKFNKKQQSKISAELKLLNLKKVNTQSDEDKGNVEVKEKSSKFQSFNDKQEPMNSIEDHEDTHQQEVDLSIFDNDLKANESSISGSQNDGSSHCNQCRQEQQEQEQVQVEGSFEQSSRLSGRSNFEQSSLELTDEENSPY